MLQYEEHCFVKVIQDEMKDPILFKFESRNSTVASFAQILWNFRNGGTTGETSTRIEELNSFFLNRVEVQWRSAVSPVSLNDDVTDQWDAPKPDYRSPRGKFLLLELHRRNFDDFLIQIDTCRGENKLLFAQLGLC